MPPDLRELLHLDPLGLLEVPAGFPGQPARILAGEVLVPEQVLLLGLLAKIFHCSHRNTKTILE